MNFKWDSQKAKDLEMHKVLFELEKRPHTFEVRSNSTKIASLLSSRFFEFGSSGKSWK